MRVGCKRQRLRDIRKRHIELLGPVMRNEEIENLIMTGKFEREGSGGRPRTTFGREDKKMKGRGEEMTGKTLKRYVWRSIWQPTSRKDETP